MSIKNYVVLMGDIVASRNTESEKNLHSNFNEVIKKINRKYKNKIISPFTITLGDEFQGLVDNLKDAFLISNEMRIELLTKKLNMRFVIGNAEIDSSIINKENSWNMIGDGLAETRELLNDKKSKNCYRFYFINKKNDLKEVIIIKLLSTLGLSMTSLESKWTDKQIETIYEYRNSDLTREELAEKLGKNRNSLYKNLKSAQVELYEEQIEAIVSSLKKYDVIEGRN